MRISIGLDLTPGSSGCLRLARWFVERGLSRPEDLLVVHVIETDHLWSAVRPFGPGTLPDALLAELRRALTAASLEGVRAEVLEAPSADQALADTMQRHRADLIIVGRRGTPSSFVRLGRVARRILRQLPAPIVVAPPEATPVRPIGPGPIVVATDLTPASAGAAAFADGLARRAGLDLLLVHVMPTPSEPHTAYLRAGVQARPREDLERERTDALSAWASEHGLEGHRRLLAHGELVETLVRVAEEHGAPLLVCGSRRLGLRERFFVSSVASTTSALAPCPVVTVPSERT